MEQAIKPEIVKYGVWLGENNLGRNSDGLWGNNISSEPRKTDEEVADIYLTNPDYYQNIKKELRRRIVENYKPLIP